jgi:anti-sigma B factor antagonist
MELEHRSEDGALVVSPVDKRLDARSAAEFKTRMAELVAAGHRRLVLNISEIEFIDSSGLGAIVSILRQLGGNGVLVICGACDTVLTMFKLTRLDKVFEMFADEQEAVAALSGGAG